MSVRKTIEFKGVELKVNYTFHKADPGTEHYGDGSGEPPTEAEAEIHEIYIQKEDVWGIMESQLEELETEIILQENER
jgi:hypothetical protein